MEKYTDLEHAINDSSLAIITEDINSLRKLNKVFLKYKSLPRKQRRISNYYSTIFLGHSVVEMNVMLKERLKAERYASGDLHMPHEKYTVTEPDLYYKEESFNSGETNICFILGHSGSGKSRMARTLEGDYIEHIELDDLLLVKDHFTMDDLKNYSDMFYDFFNGEGAKYYIGEDERESIPKEEYEDKLFVDFVKFAMDYSKQHEEKKYIVEGIWIYLYFKDPSLFEDYAVFIKGTSFLKSKIRVTKREMHRDKTAMKERRRMFEREARNYLLDEDKINIYRSFYGDKEETIFRWENKEITKNVEYVLNQLHNIDRCFVNNDPAGIKEIQKKAMASGELSKWDKARIINECQLALTDLRM